MKKSNLIGRCSLIFCAILCLASFSFAGGLKNQDKSLDDLGHHELFGQVYLLNDYVIDSNIIPVHTVKGKDGPEIPFLIQDAWLVGALQVGFSRRIREMGPYLLSENLAFPRSSSHVPDGPDRPQATRIVISVKIPQGGAFFGVDVVFHYAATTACDQVIPGPHPAGGDFACPGSYLPCYLIDDCFFIAREGGSHLIYLQVSPDIGILLRGAKNNRLGPWDWFIVADLDPNDYDNDGFYEAGLGFHTSPPGVSPIAEYGKKAFDSCFGCDIMNHIELNPPPGEGKFLAPHFDVADPHPYWPPAGTRHLEALAGESESTRPWAFTVFSDGR